MGKLTRKDLSKEFDLVVQQEIKNHNDSILATNIAINELNNKLDRLTHRSSIEIAQLESRIKGLELRIRSFEEEIESKENITNIKFENQANEFNDFKNYVNSSLDISESNSVNVITYEEFVESNKHVINAQQKNLNDQKEYLHAAIFKLKCDTEKNFENFKKEISDKPDESWTIKEDLEKKIAVCSIDAKGILRELQVHKKECFIMSKKIENIYTLLERVEKRQKSIHEVSP